MTGFLIHNSFVYGLKMKKLLLFIFLIMLFSLTACSLVPTEEPPGVGEKAELGYSTCAPIIAALEEFFTQQGTYPDSLKELIPAYLADIPSEVNQQPISYIKTDQGYSLSFHYIGPGMNTCTYTPANGWDCSGAY